MASHCWARPVVSRHYELISGENHVKPKKDALDHIIILVQEVGLLARKRSFELFDCASGCVVAVCNSSGLLIFDSLYSL